MNKNSNTIFSITAHIDLLGFSSHLVLSNYDLRTKIGKEATERLRIIENAKGLLYKELSANSDLYPKTFRYLRFNDSMILGIDIEPPILPQIGKPNKGASFTYNHIKEFFGNNYSNQQFIHSTQKHFDEESLKVCRFIGIIARIHNYINKKEYEMHMPGCRTIISSGLRYRFIDNQNEEDFYSANFSFSNAYIVNELGSKKGFVGNKCYIENNVVNISGLNNYAKRAIGFSKYFTSSLFSDPYSGYDHSVMTGYKYVESNFINIDLFNKSYQFREINTKVLSNFQLLPIIIKIEKEKEKIADTALQKIIDSLSIDTPNLEKLNSKDNIELEYPLLFFSTDIENDFKKYIDIMKKPF